MLNLSDSPSPELFGTFIDLDRTFHELSRSGGVSDDVDTVRGFQIGKPIPWATLLESFRVVILSEAGTGKTREIRNAAQILRAQGKAAFFLRLEHIANDFEDAFESETGTSEEFEAWLASNEEGWLLLDSVDEARLRDPGDFERAIRKMGRLVRAAQARTHVIITGRASAWRAKTDLDTCLKAFPPPSNATREQRPQNLDTESETDEIVHTDTRKTETKPSFLVVSLDDLSAAQVRKFATAKGVEDTQAFLAAIERSDAYSFTSRPEDLSELTQFWIDKGRIGGRLEMMQNSIELRIEERDQARRDYRPLSTVRAREGVKLIAAAATLTKVQTIRVPDGSANTSGLDVRQILDEWDDRDQITLLSRPIFDEAIYGTVRFHHRSVREYLTAEWFAELLASQTSRRAIEGLFFREQYGMEIVVPALRPILPWLILLDDRILDRVRKIAPEVIFEGGDPARLPVEVRRYVLTEVCEQISAGSSGRSMHDYSAVQRFANADIAEDIDVLLKKYADNDELKAFLLRMIWLGELASLRPTVMTVALTSNAEEYLRITAFRALGAIGSADERATVRARFLDESAELDRHWFGELIDGLEPTSSNLEWVLGCLEKLLPKERYTVDPASQSVNEFVANAEVALLPEIVTGLNKLLAQPPVIERRFCEISEKNQWLLAPASRAVARLIDNHHSAALDDASLSVLRSISAARGYSIDDSEEIRSDLRSSVSAWPELRNALFWSEVATSRRSLDLKKNERLTEHWRASLWGSFSTFGPEDFDYVLEQIVQQPLQDDKLVALSLAFSLYGNAGRPAKWRDKLKRRAAKDPVLSDRLHEYLNPPARTVEGRRLQQADARWKRQAEQRKREEAKYHAGWKAYFDTELATAKATQRAMPGELTNNLLYLFDETRKDRKFKPRWTEYNWKQLIPAFGEDVARFYRDTAVEFWRHYRPKLRSEGYPANSTAIASIIGLVGLEIEATESSNFFPIALSEHEVVQACRFASFELNGFPTWFPRLFAVFPKVASAFMMREIVYELSNEAKDADSNYILSDVSWSGQWAWDELGPAVLERLRKHEPVNAESLKKLLKILQGSQVSDDDIIELASAKCRDVDSIDNLALWFAVWCGVNPEQAIEALENKLEDIADQVVCLELVMKFATALWGGRRGESINARKAFFTPEPLKTLYLMMHEHVRREEDIERAGKGVYSPNLRDYAQEARNALLEALTRIPGKQSFLALMDISRLHPVKEMRPWMLHHAKTKAEQDGDLEPWSLRQVRTFAREIERTPANHRELAELVHLRFQDLKDDLENGDSSVASLLLAVTEETEVRKYLGHELREKARGRYSVPQEEELADAKRPDLRFLGSGFDGPVPVELKLADKWSGPDLFERLENQLCGDYLRDNRSSHGLFVLVYSGVKKAWEVANRENRVVFEELILSLADHWSSISNRFPNVDDIAVIGIDLTKRAQ
ncbi:hypothetical protein GOA69_32430 [Sinorhizobium meliloti]|nr:hypothetical protein [Sinorhizobium meliloti]